MIFNKNINNAAITKGLEWIDLLKKNVMKEPKNAFLDFVKTIEKIINPKKINKNNFLRRVIFLIFKHPKQNGKRSKKAKTLYNLGY